MSQVFPLDRIIRRVDTPRPTLEDARSERVVIVDARQGRERVLDCLPFWRLGADYRVFVVSSKGAVVCQGPTCIIRDLATGRSIGVKVRYEATCIEGKVETLVLELGTHDNPQLHLNVLLKSWIQDFLKARKRDGADVIIGFYQIKSALETELTDRAREIGLDLEAVVGLEGETDLRPFKIHTEPFSVKLKDYDDDVSIRLKAELVVDPERKIEAVLRRDQLSGLEMRVRERTRAFLVERVSVHDFQFHLRDGIRTELKAELEELLAEEGRTVAHLVLEAVGRPDIEKSRTLERSVSCKIKDPSTEVALQNTLLLDLEDLGKWSQSDFATLEDWCESSLDPVAREQLFDRSYLDLLLDFSSIEARIKERVSRQAAEVGYSVHHHIVLPDLPPLELPKGFNIEFEGEFPTRDSRIKVGLEGVFHGRIPDLRKIERFLSPRIDVQLEIKRAVLEVTKRVMHGIPPERFYMRFQQSDVEGEGSVEEELWRAIRQELEITFAVEDPTVVLKVRETPLTKRVTDLCKGNHSFDFICTPLRSSGAAETVPFVVYFEVLGVRDWFTFYSKGYESAEEEIPAIKEILGAELRSMLETIPQEQLQYQEIQGKTVVAQHVFVPAVKKIDEVFGLVVRIITMRRKLTARERALQSVNEDYAKQYEAAEIQGLQKKLDHRLSEYDRLVERLDELQQIEFNPDDIQIQRLREQIAELERQITQKAPDFGPKLITEGTGDSTTQLLWKAYGEGTALITSGGGPSADEVEPSDG